MWGKEEIKNLIDTVSEMRQHNKSLMCAFVVHADKYNRSPNTVKNFYYKYKLYTKTSFDKQSGTNDYKMALDSKVINIATCKKRTGILQDKDITALFLGLVRLIKAEAAKDASAELKKECEFATYNYQKTLNLLKLKENELDKLKSINETLNKQVEQLKDKS